MAALADVVQRAIDGDPAAWKDLLARFSALVRKITYEYRLSHADSADVSQFVWMTMYERLRTVRNPERLGAWIATVARNECRRLVRHCSREITVAEPELADRLATTEEASEPVIAADTSAHIWTTVRDILNERGYTMILMMMSNPPASYEQVSHHLAIPLGSIGPTRQRCLAQLRTHTGLQESLGMTL